MVEKNNETSQPLLFLDVDGVLNCPSIKNEEKYDHHILDGMPVFVPPGTKERIEQLREAYTIVWATAWLGSAHSSWRHILELDVESWEYVDYYNTKLVEIIRIAGERKWAWVDDDIELEFRELGWPRDFVDGLLIEPNPEIGLTDEHVNILLEWASK